MLEMLFEYVLSIIDYSYLLYFYLKLIDEDWTWKKAIPAILIISTLQFIKDSYIDFGTLTLIFDKVFVILYLYIYSKRHTLNNFLYAMIFDGIFVFSIVFFVACANIMNIDIEIARSFGLERILFAFFTKIFAATVLFFMQKPLMQLHKALTSNIENIMLFIMSMILIVFSSVYGEAENDSHIFMFVFTLSIIMFCVFYLFYKYCILMKKQTEAEFVAYAKEVTSEHVIKLENEFEEIKKIRHDMKNQLTIIDALLKNENYSDAHKIITELTNDMEQSKVTISGNLYLDAILRQKMKEYNDIRFDLDIYLTKDCQIDGKDMISLFSNIIDNACEELNRVNGDSFQLQVKGNATQIRIKEINMCRDNSTLHTDKDENHHGYGLKIIRDIVDRYEGVISIDVEDGKFFLSILLLI